MSIRCAAVCAVLLCLFPAPGSSATVAELVKGAGSPEVGAARSAANRTMSVGHLTLNLTSGSAATITSGGGVIGLYFKGNGSFRYEAAEPTELPSLAYNLRGTHLQLAKEGARAAVTGKFSELLIYGVDQAVPALEESASEALGESMSAHAALFARDHSLVTPHFVVMQKLLPAAPRYVRAEINGGGEPLVYTYDAVEQAEESLQYLHGSGYPEDDKQLALRLYATTLSSQPIGRPRTASVKPDVALTAVDYSLTTDGDEAKLEVTETLFRASTAINVVRYDQQDEIFVKANRPFRHFNVRSVTDEQGRSLPFDHFNGSLLVLLDGVQGQTFKLKFTIDGDFLVREGGDNAWQLGTWSWFPQPGTDRQAYTVHSLLRVKKPFVPYAPGRTIRRGEEGDYNVVENVVDKAVRYTVAHAGKYTSIEEKRDGLTIRVASYGLPRPRASKQLIELAFGIVDYYQYFLGPFPFPELNIIQVNDYGWGQAPPGTMFITNEAFDPVIDTDAQYYSEGINERFAHEIAHQYWGHVVAWPSPEEQWLSESFAEYSAALMLKKYKGEAVYNRLVKTWRSRGAQATDSAPIPYANRVGGDPRSAFMNRFGLLYGKGPYLLYTLHKQLGDERFLVFLKSYQKSFQWKFGSTNDVAGLLQFMTKTDYKPFFDKYFWGTAMPE